MNISVGVFFQDGTVVQQEHGAAGDSIKAPKEN